MNQHDKVFLRDLSSAVREGRLHAAPAAAVKSRFRALQSATPLKEKIAAARRNAVAIGLRKYSKVSA